MVSSASRSRPDSFVARAEARVTEFSGTLAHQVHRVLRRIPLAAARRPRTARRDEQARVQGGRQPPQLRCGHALARPLGQDQQQLQQGAALDLGLLPARGLVHHDPELLCEPCV